MAKISVFNPPPHWPAPPPGWTPPPDWQPDPAWGPVPPGWSLWVRVRANPRAWGWAALAGAAWFVVFCVIGLVVSGGRFGAEAAGAVLGREILAAVLTGLVAWVGRSRWPVWLYPVVVLGFSLVLSALATVGRLS